MGTFSKAIAIWLIILVGMVEAIPQTEPDMVLGTESGTYKLFTPTEVVAAGGGGGNTGTANVYKFFQQRDIVIAPITSDTNVRKDVKKILGGIAKQTYSEGLITAPFYTFFEGDIHVDLSSKAVATLEMAIIHTFAGDKKLTTTRDIIISNLGNAGYDFALNEFNSVFPLRLGEITLDDGSKLNVTNAVLADPVDIEVTFSIAFAAAETIETLAATDARVSWVQFVNEVSGGGGGGADLSNKTPLVERGTGAPGSGTEGSRDDHVHPLRSITPLPAGLYPVGTSGNCLKASTAGAAGTGTLRYGDCGSPRVLSDADPKVDATAAPGTNSRVSRSDHVHPLPAVAVLSDKAPLSVALTSSAGTGTEASRNDHVHQDTGIASTLDPKPITYTGRAGPGTGNQLSRTDHQHATTLLNHASNQKGHVLTLTSNDTNGAYSWEAPATAALSDSTPITDGTGAAGTGTEGSRADHVHPEKDAHTFVLSGLPATTGHGGSVLTVTTDQAGVEWKAASGGGSSGGAGRTITKISDTFTSTDRGSNKGYTWSLTQDQKDALVAALSADDYHQIGIRWWRGSVPDRGELWQYFDVSERPGADVWSPSFSMSAGEGTLRSWLSWDTANQPYTLMFAWKPKEDSEDTDDAKLQTALTRTANNELGAPFASSVEIYKITYAGGGGGGTNPTIPKPTTAGKLKHLRVNAAGAAYELADPPASVELSDSPGASVSGMGGASGTARTASRQDHTHKVDLQTATPQSLDGTAGSAGSKLLAAREDHRHQIVLASQAPPAIGTAAVGVSTTPARSDHVHGGGNVTNPSQLANLDNGFIWSTAGCKLDINTNKTNCTAGWRRPTYWERVVIYSKSNLSWTSHDASFFVPEETYDLHAFMEGEDSFREFEINIRWVKTQKTSFQQIKIAGLTHGNKLGANENAVFYSLNSNNSVDGALQYARMEVPHSGAWQVHMGFNSLGVSSVNVQVVGIR